MRFKYEYLTVQRFNINENQMKNISIALWVFIIAIAFLTLQSCKTKKAELSNEYISLFDGKTLKGWEKHGHEKWYVTNGEIICESGPREEYGYLSTSKYYDDFELSLEFLQEANGNSGVFIRSTLDGTKISGWQAEVAPPGHHSGGIYESYGRGWLIKPDPTKDKALKMGEWNNMVIKAIGDEITTFINGTQMIHLKDDKIGEGKGSIALQIHDGGGIKVRWKNIKIKNL